MGIVMAITRQNWSTQPCINPMYKECKFTLKGAMGTKVNDLTKYYMYMYLACIDLLNTTTTLLMSFLELAINDEMKDDLYCNKNVYFYIKAYIIMKNITLFFNHDHRF
jgi:hypothetical protein